MGSGSSTNRPVQMKDIAKDLGVSGVTLSKVIRGRSDISWATRRRVFKRVKELNYQPNWLTEGGRVAQPFGFALTDPYVRLSRIRLFPKVTCGPQKFCTFASSSVIAFVIHRKSVWGTFSLRPASGFGVLRKGRPGQPRRLDSYPSSVRHAKTGRFGATRVRPGRSGANVGQRRAPRGQHLRAARASSRCSLPEFRLGQVQGPAPVL